MTEQLPPRSINCRATSPRLFKTSHGSVPDIWSFLSSRVTMPVHLFAGSLVYSFARPIDVYVFMKLCSSFIREIGFAACISSVRTLICISYSSPMLGIVIHFIILQTFVVNKFSKYIVRVVGNFMKFWEMKIEVACRDYGTFLEINAYIYLIIALMKFKRNYFY